jgi:hypothetical protein
MKVLSAVFQFVFGCRHRHLSRVFTIKHSTYKVCFDCRLLDTQNLAIRHRNRRTRTQKLTCQGPFTKKLAFAYDRDRRFLADLGHDGSLTLPFWT